MELRDDTGMFSISAAAASDDDDEDEGADDDGDDITAVLTYTAQSIH